MNRYRRTPNFMGTNYEDTLAFHVYVMKDVCSHPAQEDMVFTQDEVDEIVSWITASQYPTLFHMYDQMQYDYFAVCDDIEPQIVNSYVVGFDISFVTNAPYAWTQEKTTEIIIPVPADTSSTELPSVTQVVHVVNSERLEEIFPVITIVPNLVVTDNKLTYTITNNRDHGTMKLMNILKDTTTIDCQKAMISSTTGLLTIDELGWSDVDSIYWPRLYHGDNELIIKGQPATIILTYREPRKVGAY